MKRDYKRFCLSVILMAAVAVIIYVVFKDSWPEIWRQLKHADKRFLGILFLLGNAYYVFDGISYWYIIKCNGEKCSIADCIKMSYMGVFFNVTTLGAGTKASQVVYMDSKGIDPGKSFGLLVMEYVSHKIAIVLLALAALLSFGRYINSSLAHAKSYIYAGFFLSAAIVGFLMWICVSRRVHRLLIVPCRKFIKRERWLGKIDEFEKQLKLLHNVSLSFTRNIKGWCILIIIGMVKMFFWYAMPYTAYNAVIEENAPVTLLNGTALSAVMQFLIGVLPGMGGTGSTEVAYTFIYGEIFGMTQAASTMLLYRCYNYYVPFLISVVLLAVYERSIRKKYK